ncbi:MAG: hypothetical protein LBP55_04760 [Candidatus Adiutrix sp.]|jgi:hypothetical protein|nr:hypothetical protein [Candidatus Adiutrix sp.]
MRLKYVIFLMLGIILAPGPKAGAEPPEEPHKDIKGVISEMMTTVTGVAAGMSEGIQDGVRKGRELLDGSDGVRSIGQKEDMAALIQGQVLKLENAGQGRYKVTLALRNSNDFPVRIVNLGYDQSVVLLDSEGFAYLRQNPAEQGANITVPARASVRASFTFEGVEGTPSVIRLHDTDFKIP